MVRTTSTNLLFTQDCIRLASGIDLGCSNNRDIVLLRPFSLLGSVLVVDPNGEGLTKPPMYLPYPSHYPTTEISYVLVVSPLISCVDVYYA